MILGHLQLAELGDCARKTTGHSGHGDGYEKSSWARTWMVQSRDFLGQSGLNFNEGFGLEGAFRRRIS
ncbi:MAG: hypothetical protein DMG82_15375 [Acidobacteria bacterium]|nr:MAG: hypothetical protein DMG82_15375 [Acidobacteriota bacterium]